MDIKKGVTVYDVISKIIQRNPEILSVSVIKYPPSTNWKDSSLGDLVSHFSAQIEMALRHFPGKYLVDLPREKISTSLFLSLKSDIDERDALGILSKVDAVTDYKELHIPMMDFCCSVSVENMKIIKKALWEIGEREGVLLESGRSYHYYGLSLLTPKEWVKFLSKCLLLTGLVDPRYIGHSLLENSCCLRISTTTTNKPHLPEVVTILGKPEFL
jgi:hypothetical protein